VKSKRHAKRTQLCTEEAQDAGLKEERPKRHTKKGSRCPDDVQDIVPKKEKPKRHSKKARICTEEVQYKAAYSDKVKTCGGGVPFFVPSNIPKKMRSKRRARKAQILPHKPCIKSSETEDGDDMTLACFLHNKSKKKLSKCTKNASQASSSSKTKTVFKLVENQISCGEQHRLSVSCAIDGTKGLLMQAEVDSSRQVRKLESANAARKPEDAHNLNGDNKDIPLKFYVRKKKKLIQATEGRRVC
jgi:hypothetical protein